MFTTEDKAFVRTILANPAELTAWLVYADWLDEHNNPLQAEFLRLEVRRGQLSNTDPEWFQVEERLLQLRAELDRNWVAVFDRPKIENCADAFRYECPKQWEQLKVTGDPAVRHCDACAKKVYFCHSLREAQEHARRGDCVAVQLDVLRRPGDLHPPRPKVPVRTGEFAPTVGLFNVAYAPPEPPRRPWWKFW